VGPADPPNPVLVSVLDAAIERGHRSAIDISSGLEIGFGFTDLNIVDGRRQTAADAYLLPASTRPNLDVVVDAVVHRLRIEGGRCTGVEYSVDTSQTVSTAAAGEVVLSAGAIGSPQLLMMSGVGPAAHLRGVGVDVVCDLPGVGSNFHDHPLTPLVYRSAKPVPVAQNNHGELLGLVSTGRTGDVPDIQIIGVDSSIVPGLGGATDSYVVGVSVLQPFSRGTVRLSGPSAKAAPVIDPNYFGDERDLDTMVEGLRIAREIGTARALYEWRAEEIAPGDAITDDEGLRGYVKQMFSSYFHPVGTCAIGEGPNSVVDSDLRVRGVDNLRVIDASVMPTIPSNNTVATVYAIAELGADLIRR
jgi:choline dehydrogenase